MRSALLMIAGFSAVVAGACRRDRAQVIVHVGTDLSASQLEMLTISAKAGAREDSIPGAVLGAPVLGIREVSFGMFDPESGEVALEITGFASGATVFRVVRTISTFGSLHVWIFIPAECPELATLAMTDRDEPSWDAACSMPPPPPPEDAGTVADARDAPDALDFPDADETPDAAIDAGVEVLEDAGLPDPPDSGDPDSGIAPDAAPNDAGCVDSGASNRSFRATGNMEHLDFGTDTIYSLQPITTIEMWIRVHAQPAGGIAILRGDLPTAPDHWRIDFEGASQTILFVHHRGNVETIFTNNTWPPDHLWHHLALEISENAGQTELRWYFDGIPGATVTTTPWPAEPVRMSSPANSGAAQLMLDDVHLSATLRRTNQSGMPPRDVAADALSLGLWKMNEPNGSVTAYDTACRNHASAPRGDFDNNVP